MTNYQMPVLTSEQRENAAAECRRMISEAENPAAGYRTRAKGRVARIALASLTAKPVACCTLEDGAICSDGFGEYENDLPDGIHVLYSAPPVPVLPPGWKLVPIEPTEDMVIYGFESAPDKLFSAPDQWEKYEAMSGCQKAAHRARLCWTAMLAAAPQTQTSTNAQIENDGREG